MDQLTAMRTFTRLVVTGSFSAVARELNTTQPTISKRLAALEAKLGARLIERGNRRLLVTEVGADYYDRCLNILAEVEEAEEIAGSLTTQPRGRLRVSTPIAFGRLHLAPRIGPFLKRYPGIELDIMMNDRHVDLIAEGVDMALRIGAMKDSSLVALRLGNSPRVATASPAYFTNYGFPKQTEDLKDHNCIVYSEWRTGNIWHLYKGARDVSIQVHGNLQSNNSDTIRQVVLAGTGLAVLPRWLIQPDLDAGTLVTCLDGYRPLSLPILAVYPSRRHIPLKIRCFAKYLKEEFCTDPLFQRVS